MSPNFGPSPTPPTWNTPASTGVTPKPTNSPHQQHNGLLRRDTPVGKNTCGWINGDPTQPFACDSSHICVAEPQSSAFGCCDSRGGCYFETACINSDIGDCFYTNISDCDAWALTLGCTVGSSSCGTYVMPGGVPLTSVGCNNNPDTVYIQTTYAGGPANQQVPMPFTDYLAVVGSAAASLSAAQASSTSSSDSSSDSTASDWTSHHKALLIGVIAGAAVLLLLCCCFGVFRRKKRTHARPAPATTGGPPPQYYVPQQETQGQGQRQEHYPMMYYQYAPNK